MNVTPRVSIDPRLGNMAVVKSNPGSTPLEVDVGIIGSGPAGSVAALVLTSLGLRVIVASAKRAQAVDRPEMLAPSATPLLAKIGLEKALASNPKMARVCHGVRSYWRSPHLGLESFDRYPAGPGWIVSRTAFDRHLVNRAEKAGAVFWHDFRVVGIRRSQSWLISGCYDNRRGMFSARFLIDASGRVAIGARKIGAALMFGPSLVTILDIRESGLGDGKDVSYLTIESTRHGWWYAMRHPDGRLLLACVTSGKWVDLKSMRSDQGFQKSLDETREMNRIAAAFAPSRLLAIKPVVDSRMSRLNQLIGADWLATGDAGAAFDPLSSQGLFHALSTGFFAGHAVASYLDGNEMALEGYATLAKRTHERTNVLISQQYQLGYKRHDTPFWKEQSINRKLGTKIVAPRVLHFSAVPDLKTNGAD